MQGNPARVVLGERGAETGVLGQMNERLGENHYAAERQEGGEVKARKIVVEEVKRLGWSAKDLGRRAKRGTQERWRSPGGCVRRRR